MVTAMAYARYVKYFFYQVIHSVKFPCGRKPKCIVKDEKKHNDVTFPRVISD